MVPYHGQIAYGVVTKAPLRQSQTVPIAESSFSLLKAPITHPHSGGSQWHPGSMASTFQHGRTHPVRSGLAWGGRTHFETEDIQQKIDHNDNENELPHHKTE